jgi:hypothetical protein
MLKLAVGYFVQLIDFFPRNEQTQQIMSSAMTQFIGLQIQLPYQINVKQRKGSKQS